MADLSRERYALLYGPTAGDRIRLADTDLFIEIEEDRSAGGDEAVFGGGKVIRESMGQSRATRAEGAADTVITGAVVLDHWGVIKADVGIRDGRIVALGKAGNPDTMDGVHPALVIGPSTEIISGNGRILTAGAIDCHVHLICPQILEEALGSGITTVIGGGTGPAEGTKATTVTPGAWHLARMLEALDPWPVNVVLLGKGNTTSAEAMWEQLRAGASGFKLHEDWGSTPAAIDACLRVADASGVQVALHSDTLNEAGFVQDTLAAIAGRGIHAYHTEGAGGGHAPDIITVAGHPNVLPSSTNPTRPHTVNTIDEHLDMLMVCHHLNPAVPEDLAFAESRIRPSTIAAEDVLHDLGAISMIGSDSQAMGRVGEVVLRTWQTAHVMKRRRGALAGDPSTNDNRRARRYVAKYTICPAVAHGLDAEIGSVEPGKLADLVLWEPAFFGVRPHAGHQGRDDRLGGHGRRQRLDPHAPARAAPAHVRRRTAGRRRHQRRLRGPGRHRRRPGRPAGRAPRAGGRGRRPAPDQGRHARERRPARHHRRARHLHRAHRRRGGRAPARHRAAHGPALLPVLMNLLLLTDGRFPAGGHAHSGGIEAAVMAGRVTGVDTLASFLAGRLTTAGRVAAALAAAAASGVHDLVSLDAEAGARIPSPALRAASRAQGRQLLRTARAVLDRRPRRSRRAAPPGGHGRGLRRHAGLGPLDAARWAAYDAISGPASAAVRLLGLDPFRAWGVVAALMSEADEIAERPPPARPGPLHQLPACSAPLLDIGAEQHAASEVRLFAS